MRLGPEPRRHIAVLACMDARMDIFALLDLERGDAHIVRNAGGIVTDDVLRSLSASQRLLGTVEVVVIMHRDCGIEGTDEYGGFEDVEEELRAGLERLRSSEALIAHDRIRGLIYDPFSDSLEEID
jgi:carbonic anhydrase